MELKDLVAFFIFNILILLNFTMGATRPRNVYKSQMQLREINPKYSARIFPFGPMPFTYSKSQMLSQTPSSPQIIPRDFLLPQLAPFLGLSDGPRAMSLDDAFKMGYEAGKSIGFGDSLRNQGRPMYGVGGSSQYGSCSGPTTVNFFFPPKETYVPDDSLQLGNTNEFDNIYDPENVYPDDDLDLAPAQPIDNEDEIIFEVDNEPDNLSTAESSSQSPDSNVTTPGEVDISPIGNTTSSEAVDKHDTTVDTTGGLVDTKVDISPIRNITSSEVVDKNDTTVDPTGALVDTKVTTLDTEGAASDSKGVSLKPKDAAVDPKATIPVPVGNATVDVVPTVDTNVPAVSNK